jgi:pseudouridine-5'-phosphate glycosidase
LRFFLSVMISFSAEVRNALDSRQPVVALESTIIAHGMPYPRNVETAMLVEETIRRRGAIPATCAIIGGKLRAGLATDELELLGKEGASIPEGKSKRSPLSGQQGHAPGLPQ